MHTAMVVGMARSGIASARLLCQNGWRVLICDSRSEIEGLQEALSGISYTDLLGEDPSRYMEGVELIVLSPGVSMFQSFVEQAREAGIAVIGEIELGYRYAKGDFLCVTGTNGKTTCTMLAGEVLKQSGKRVHVLGNMGLPIARFAPDTKEGDVIVAETAALQLEGNVHFHAKIAAVTNIAEDHLDRFRTMEYYIATKKKILLNQTAEDFAVLNYDDTIVRAFAGDTPAQAIYFSKETRPPQGVWLEDGVIRYDALGQNGVLINAAELRIPGVHNLENAMLAAAMGLAAGVPVSGICEALRTFPGVEHRIEFVAEKQGVRYINDSKGTNPDSTRVAIAAMDRPTVLILGGYDKHSNFVQLFAQMKKSGVVKAAVVLGETARKLLDAAREAGFDEMRYAEKGFLQAVELAKELAAPGDAVLLSPACASWDMFPDFEARGRRFKEIVLSFAD